MRRSPFALLLVLPLLLAACKPSDQGGFVVVTAAPITPVPSGDAGAGGSGSTSSSGPATASMIPVIISSSLAVGDNRFVFSFVDPKTQQPVGSPDIAAAVSFIAPGTTEATAATTAQFVWAIEGSRGEYLMHATFPAAGDWKAIFVVQPKDGKQQAIGIGFTVALKADVISIGDHAPASRTPTLTDVGGDIRQISTDTNPDPAFYQVSVAQALERHQPFILVFATPAFCRSAQCGPTLDTVKKARSSSPATVAFINVEPYVMRYTDGRLQPVLDSANNLQPNDISNAWRIPTEPWIFAVDRNGIVQGSFEGIATPQELSDAIAKIAQS